MFSRLLLEQQDSSRLELKSGPPEIDLQLNHRCLVILDCLAGKVNYSHQVRKALKQDKYEDNFGFGRINITFRTINI